MAYQSQANGLIAFKAQGAKGTVASGGSGFVLRTAGGPGGRLVKGVYESNEVRRDLMRIRGRHGLRQVSGSYTVEVSLDNCDDFYQALFRGAWEAPITVTQATAGLTSVTSNATGIFTAAAGSWITAGLRVGDVVAFTGLNATGNNSRNFRITALTATVMTVASLDGLPVITDGVADTTFSVVRTGQKLICPAAGASVNRYFTIEEYDGDLDLTEIFVDCVITSVKFTIAPGGLITSDIAFTGTGLFQTATGASAPTFTTPTESVGLPLSSVDAVLRYGSADFADLTSWDLTIEIGGVAPEVVGSVISPDVFTGQMAVSMNFTTLRQDYARMIEFLNETPAAFHVVMAENDAEPKDFMSIYVPNLTLGGIDKSPLSREAGPRTQSITVPAGLIGKDTSGGAFDATMVKLQVSNL
jgi:hypothetical protein